MIKVGYAVGICSRCGKTLTRSRPADTAVCDCWEYCPECGARMEPYNPDLTPLTYKEISENDYHGDLENPMEIIMVCPTCHYLTRQKPVEVQLR